MEKWILELIQNIKTLEIISTTSHCSYAHFFSFLLLPQVIQSTVFIAAIISNVLIYIKTLEIIAAIKTVLWMT